MDGICTACFVLNAHSCCQVGVNHTNMLSNKHSDRRGNSGCHTQNCTTVCFSSVPSEQCFVNIGLRTCWDLNFPVKLVPIDSDNSEDEIGSVKHWLQRVHMRNAVDCVPIRTTKIKVLSHLHDAARENVYIQGDLISHGGGITRHAAGDLPCLCLIVKRDILR